MRADELLVERFLNLEKELELSKETIKDLQEDNQAAQEEIADYGKLIEILSRYLKVTKFGVSFELKNYIAADQADIDYLANYFDVEFKEETKGENG